MILTFGMTLGSEGFDIWCGKKSQRAYANNDLYEKNGSAPAMHHVVSMEI